MSEFHPRKYPFSPMAELKLCPEYDDIRPEEPITPIIAPYGEGRAWLAIGYDEAKAVFGSTKLSRLESTTFDVPRPIPFQHGPNVIFSMDNPRHNRLRSLAGKAFTRKRLDDLRPHIRQIAKELVADVQDRGGPAELVEAVFLPLPLRVICELLGVPYSDQAWFREITERRLAMGDNATMEDAVAAHNELDAYLRKMLAQRGQGTEADLIGALMLAREDDGDRLTEDELVNLAISLLIGGHETTASFLGKSLFLLLSHPEELAKLRANPDILPDAIEECLRFAPLSKGPMMPRVAPEAMDFQGVHLEKGDAVMPDSAAANRDPRVFKCPNQFDITREKQAHLTFGFGIHHCLGAMLARMELVETIGELLRAFPNLALASPPEDVVWNERSASRQPKALHVIW